MAVKASGQAGITYGRKIKGGMTFHDIRHTFNTNMCKADVSEAVIMSMTGRATRKMFDRYNKIDLKDIHEAAESVKVFS